MSVSSYTCNTTQKKNEKKRYFFIILIPETYPSDSERPALAAYFHMARLYDKYILPEKSQAKLKCKMQTYCCYLKIVEYCEKNPKAAECVEVELPLCKEMISLLPMKIQKMKKELILVNTNTHDPYVPNDPCCQ